MKLWEFFLLLKETFPHFSTVVGAERGREAAQTLCVFTCVCVKSEKMRILVLLPDHEKRRIKSEVKAAFCCVV